MEKKISLESIKEKLKKVKHPAINSSLYDLGIIKGVELEGNKAIILLAFPFPNIPIKDALIEQVNKALAGLELEIEIKTTVMDENELRKFMSLEQANWRG